MEPLNVMDWELVQKAASRVVKANRRRLILSNEEVEDCVSELVVEFAVRQADYKGGSGSKRQWLEQAMSLSLNDIVSKLRDGGLTGEEYGELYDIAGKAPKSRGRGDTVFGGKEDHRPTLAEVLEFPPTDQALNEATVDALLATLGPIDAQLLTDYYGLNGADSRTLEEIAAGQGVSVQAVSQRIRRIEKRLAKAFKKLQKPRLLIEQDVNINTERAKGAA